MYFQSLDTFHLFLTSLFLLTSLGIVFFRYKKYSEKNEQIMNYVEYKKWVTLRITSLVISIILLSVAFLEPMGLIQNSITRAEWVDCIWLLDVSLSMDTEDGGDDNTLNISRLSRAKSIIENYMITHPENRYGLIIFAGTSRLVSPLTAEHSSLLTFLSSIDSKSIKEWGTDFRDVLSLAVERFETKNNILNSLVLLSDGGDREDAPDMDSLRNLFQGKQAILTTVWIWKIKPSPIPMGQNPFWERTYKKFQWETVLSRLNKETLKSLATLGWWSYIEGVSIEKDLEKSLSTQARHSLWDSWGTSDDKTVHIIVILSFLFFLIFLLLPSSFIKSWGVL